MKESQRKPSQVPGNPREVQGSHTQGLESVRTYEGMLEEAQESAREVQGSAREVPGNPRNYPGTYRYLFKTFRQAIQVKMKPMLCCEDNLEKVRISPRKSQEAQERPRKPRRQLYK
jgi:hypothetical protein